MQSKLVQSKLATLAFSTLLLMGVWSSPAFAQSKKDLAAQNAALEQRLSRLEQRMLTGDPAAERLMQRIDTLETSQRALRGELERITFERDNLKSEVDALAGDVRAMQGLSNRMKIHLDAVDLVARETNQAQQAARNATLSGQPSSSATGPISAVPSAPTLKEQTLNVPSVDTLGGQAAIIQSAPSNDVTQLGQLGKTKLAEGDYAGAQVALSQYLQFNPDAADAGEMQYWLGESYFVRGGYADAADAYIGAMRKAPQGAKAPDAMVRLAASLRELGQISEACQTLASFPAQFPNASATVRAKANTEAARTGC
ncbi:tol-pal system protein YbgF [Litorimonas sp. RW-G-Af-16]|uniref:tol-pal system protein YbgF n=1 Tax=Litorimonas sp. RW-G-Af-16 TaxID=3241168 RepID=UPI00390C58D5